MVLIALLTLASRALYPHPASHEQPQDNPTALRFISDQI
jgi:hypothetical protein